VSPVIRIEAGERRRYADRFRSVSHLRTCVDSVLEGRCGHLFADSVTETASVLAPPFWIPVGPSEGAAADELVSSIDGLGGVIVADDAWQSRVKTACGDRSSEEQRTPFSAENLDVSELRALLVAAPEGVTVTRLDARLAAEAAAGVNAHLVFETSFATPQAFEAGGIGFGVILNGTPVAGASSAFVSDEGIEVQVNTHEDFRGRGFATLASAALLVACLERGLTPHWDTGDPVSDRLARRLGYVPLPDYSMLEVTPP